MFFNCFSQDDLNENGAKQIIQTFFEGFHKGDTLLMRSVMDRNMSLQTAFIAKDGSNVVSQSTGKDFLTAIANRPADQKWEEKLLSFKGFKDGNLGLAWTDYEFWLNGKFSHCGANCFTLVKTDNGWKILNIIDSRRRQGCSQ